MDLRCITCDIPVIKSSENDISLPIPECKSFVMTKIINDCLQINVTNENVVCDGCKVQLILFYQFKLKVAALQLRRLREKSTTNVTKDSLQDENVKNTDDQSEQKETKLNEIPPISDGNNRENNSSGRLSTSNGHTCPHCSASFLVQSALNAHIQGLHSSEKSSHDLKQHKSDTSQNFICHICGNRFNNVSKLRGHIKTKHEEVRKSDEIEPKKSQMIACDICHKILSNRSALRRHKILIHNIGNKNLPFSCEICNSHWATKASLDSHHLRKHTTDRKFKCAVCDKNFITKEVLVSHINRVHCYTNNFICHTCGKSFKNQTYLKTHYLVHSQQKAFICPDCGVSFKQKATLYSHRKMHREKQAGVKYECQICQTTFISARTLKKHQMSHVGPDLKCDQCGKMYKQKDSLSKHILSVHNRIKVRVTCRLCDKTLWNRNRMRTHVQEDHADELKKDVRKTVDDFLQKSRIFDEMKVKETKSENNLKIISVQILNHV